MRELLVVVLLELLIVLSGDNNRCVGRGGIYIEEEKDKTSIIRARVSAKASRRRNLSNMMK
jgi:hypothetical protein